MKAAAITLRRMQTPLLIFSLSLNFAFAGVWGYHYFYVTPRLRKLDELEARLTEQQQRQMRTAPPAARLKLTAEERRKMAEAGRSFREQLMPVRAEIRRQRERLYRLMAAPEPDREAILQCQAAISEGQRRMQQMTVEHLLDVKGRLGPEQQKRFWRMMKRGRGLHARQLGRTPRREEGREPPERGTRRKQQQ